MARGLIQPDGTFELSTYDDGDGAQIGTFSATVTELLKDRASKEEIAAKYPIRIPKRYNRPATSGLTVEVKAGESNQVELALTTNPE